MARRGAAAPADDVDEPALGEFPELFGQKRRRVVVAAEFVRQARVGIHADGDAGDARELPDMGSQRLGAEGAVEPDRHRLRVRDGIPERLRRLPGERAPGGIRDRAGDHHRPPDSVGVEVPPHRVDGRLGVQGVEYRLDQNDVRAAVDQAADRLGIGGRQGVERNVPETGIVHVGRDRRRSIGRAESAGDEPGLVRGRRRDLVRDVARETRALAIELVGEVLQPVVGLRDRRRVEGVRLDDIGPGVQEGAVDFPYHVRPREGQEIVVAREVPGVVGEPFAAEIGLAETVLLDHRPHGAVEQEDPLVEQALEGLRRIGARSGIAHGRSRA